MRWEEHAAQLARAKEAENRKAAALLESFAAAAAASGLEPQPLVARSYSGGRPVRTNVRGWDLRRDQSAAVDAAGRFYLLAAPVSLIDRVRGVRLDPSPAPLVLGSGSRDGESIALVEALQRLLPSWRPPEG